MNIGIALYELPGMNGLTKTNVMDLMDTVATNEVYPMEIGGMTLESAAMGFITSEAADKLDYEYGQDSAVGKFIASILDDINKETEDGIYEFQGITIFLSRP